MFVWNSDADVDTDNQVALSKVLKVQRRRRWYRAGRSRVSGQRHARIKIDTLACTCPGAILARRLPDKTPYAGRGRYTTAYLCFTVHRRHRNCVFIPISKITVIRAHYIRSIYSNVVAFYTVHTAVKL